MSAFKITIPAWISRWFEKNPGIIEQIESSGEPYYWKDGPVLATVKDFEDMMATLEKKEVERTKDWNAICGTGFLTEEKDDEKFTDMYMSPGLHFTGPDKDWKKINKRVKKLGLTIIR